VNGDHVFNVYKIRSMKKFAPVVPTNELNDAEEFIDGWGKFLRLNSIDEILNLISVVTGDMNFIGPRPIMIEEYELLKLRASRGITGPAGITGLAQINGRDNIRQSRKVACECYYQCHRHSFKLNIFIIAKTVNVVLMKTGISH
jgi:O-antigen biosynthesis protein WbqP